MNELIAFFEYNDTKYLISKIKNNKIIFLKSNKNNEVTKNLSNDEITLVKKVYNNLLVTHNKSIYIKDMKVRDNIYKLYIDTNSHNYFWIPTNGQYNEKDNIFLNFNYNHQPEVLYTENDNNQTNKPSKFYTKFVKIGSKLISVLVSATLSLTILSSCILLGHEILPQTETSSHSVSVISETESTREYNYEEIRQAIESNQNIGDEEKELLYKLKFIFDENNQYMDLDTIIERLKTLKINYDVNISAGHASYHINKNEISSEAENFSSMKKADFIHEFLHVLQSSGNPFIGELSTEFFTRETMIRLYKEDLIEKEFFLSQYDKEEYEKGNLVLNNETDWFKYLSNNNRFASGYNEYVNLYYILAELVPQEALRDYQFNPTNIGVLISALTEIDNSIENETDIVKTIERGYQLITSINDLRVYSEESGRYFYLNDTSNCCQLLNYYYKEAKGIELNEDPTCCLYLQLENRLENNFNSYIFDYMSETYSISNPYAMTAKTYLSDAQKNPVLVYYNDNKDSEIFEITDEIKEEYKSYTNNGEITSHLKK